jgi:hypothetical protein
MSYTWVPRYKTRTSALKFSRKLLKLRYWLPGMDPNHELDTGVCARILCSPFRSDQTAHKLRHYETPGDVGNAPSDCPVSGW